MFVSCFTVKKKNRCFIKIRQIFGLLNMATEKTRFSFFYPFLSHDCCGQEHACVFWTVCKISQSSLMIFASAVEMSKRWTHFIDRTCAIIASRYFLQELLQMVVLEILKKLTFCFVVFVITNSSWFSGTVCRQLKNKTLHWGHVKSTF